MAHLVYDLVYDLVTPHIKRSTHFEVHIHSCRALGRSSQLSLSTAERELSYSKAERKLSCCKAERELQQS